MDVVFANFHQEVTCSYILIVSERIILFFDLCKFSYVFFCSISLLSFNYLSKVSEK